jgi:hypothetical protein
VDPGRDLDLTEEIGELLDELGPGQSRLAARTVLLAAGTSLVDEALAAPLEVDFGDDAPAAVAAPHQP